MKLILDCLWINGNDNATIFMEPRAGQCIKGFLSFGRKYEKQLLDTGVNSLRTTLKKQYIKPINFI